MARIAKGILGPVNGTVGTVIGSSWKGINYIKSQPGGRKASQSVAQIDHQLKFSVTMRFCQAFTALWPLTFKKYANEMSEFNAAFSYNYQNALTGLTPDYEIDYQKALISRGELPNAVAPSAAVTGTEVFFTWTNNAGTGEAQATDNAVLVAYCKELGQAVFTTGSATRITGSGTLNVAAFTGQAIETWIAFLSADGTLSSGSLFTGELTV
jgi:hypothetical protein